MEAQGHRHAPSLELTAPKAHVEGTAEKTDFMFHEGPISWDLDGTTIAGFQVDPTAGIGGLPLKVLGPLALNTDGSSTLDVLPGMPPELLGKTPSAPKHLMFGPSANAAALGAFSFHVDQIPLGVILLGPVTVSYDGAGSWDIAAEADDPVPDPDQGPGPPGDRQRPRQGGRPRARRARSRRRRRSSSSRSACTSTSARRSRPSRSA